MTDSANATRLGVQLDFDAMVEDPHPVYDQLRIEQPCAWSPQLRSWIVTRYADVARVDRDTEAFSAVLDDDPATLVRGRAMTRTDGVEHRRLRKAAGAPLRPRVVEQQWTAIVAEHVDRHVARVDGSAHFDILGEFATPLMADVLIDVLGFEGITADDVSRWSATFVAGVSAHEDDPAVWAAVRASREEVQAHVVATAERVRKTPDHTVVSAMLTASGGEPDLEEIGSNVRLLISGGYNEPRDMIATLAWLLLAYPAERAGALTSP
jgi:cytochrome P450